MQRAGVFIVGIFVVASAICYVHVVCVWTDAGIDAHEGMDVLKNAGIALAISFSILGFIVFLVNIIKLKCVKHSS